MEGVLPAAVGVTDTIVWPLAVDENLIRRHNGERPDAPVRVAEVAHCCVAAGALQGAPGTIHDHVRLPVDEALSWHWHPPALQQPHHLTDLI